MISFYRGYTLDIRKKITKYLIFSFIPVTSKEVKNKSLPWDCFQAWSAASSLNPLSELCEDTVSLTHSTELQHQPLSQPMVKFALNITALGGNTQSWSTARTTGAAQRRWTQLPWCQQGTQLHRNREFSETTVFVAQWEDWMRKEQDAAWILPGLTSANNTVAPLSIYTAIKAMALYSTYPTPMKYLLIRKALSIPGISLLSLLGCQKTIHVKEKQL